MKLPPRTARRAFTLVEMSVVLVIISLIVGGILQGRNMIRAAEVRSIVTDASNYKAAITQFKTQYRYLPGDMPNATQYWTGGVTQNGNANGYVEYTGTAGNFSEAFTFWQHLALAGMVQGNFTGKTDTTGTRAYISSVNAPAAQIDGVVWGAAYVDGTLAANTFAFARDYRNWFTAGTLVADTDLADTPFLRAEEAATIDTKMDDGLPANGAVQTAYAPGGSTALGCTNAADKNTLTAVYQTANKAKNQCDLLFQYPK